MTEDSFKNRVQSHYTSFNNPAYKHEPSLSTYIWKLQEKNKTYQLYWEILEKVPKYRPGNVFCNVCTSETLWIIAGDGPDLLNKKEEFVSKCRHKRKFRLVRVKHSSKVDLLRHTATNDGENQAENVDNSIVVDQVLTEVRRSSRTRKPNPKFMSSDWAK